MADGAQKEAQVKLRLDSSEYVVELKRIGDMNQQVVTTSRRGFRRMGKGIDAVKNEVSGLSGRFKDLLKAQLAMVTGMAFTGIIGKVVDFKSNLIGLQNELERATGRTVDLADMQERFERAASKTGRTASEMLAAFQGVRDTTQNLEYAEETLELAATAANAAKKPVEAMAAVVGELNKRFEITADQAPEAMAKVIDHASRGAFPLENIGAIMEKLGPTMKEAGLTGTRGLNVMLGMFEDVGNKLGTTEQKLTGVQNAMLNLSQPGRLLAIAKALRLKGDDLIDEKDSIATMRRILQEGDKGVGQLREKFVGPEERKAISMLIEPFEKAHAKATERGATAQEALKEGLAAFDEQIQKFGKSSTDYAKLQEQAARQLDSPEAKLRAALERIQEAFRAPGMIRAIETVADKLPVLAEALAKMISFTVDHPLIAGGAALGGKATMTFAQASIAESMGKGGVLHNAAASGAKLGQSFLSTVAAKGGPWKTAGQSFAAAAALVLAYEIGKAVVDSLQEESLNKHTDASRAHGMAISALGGDRETKVKALSDAKKGLADLEKEQASPGWGDPHSMSGQFGLWAGNVVHQGGRVVGADVGISGQDISDATNARPNEIARMKRTIAMLEASIQATPKGGSDSQGSGDKSSARGSGGKQKVEIENTNMLAQHMAQGIGQRELRVRVMNLPASGFDTGESGSRGPARPGAPSPSGGTGGT